MWGMLSWGWKFSALLSASLECLRRMLEAMAEKAHART